MENNETPQPLDTLMTKLGLTNAQLVNASTEQLSFKMVQKARKGRRISPNIQAKILTALTSVRPDLKIRRRDLFRYDMDPAAIKAIENSLKKGREKKVTYPQLVELLAKAGVTGYQVEVAGHHITYFGTGGEAFSMSGETVSASMPGIYNEQALKAAILGAQTGALDYQGFLSKIYEAGIVSYDVNIRDLVIKYRGETQSYKEKIGQPSAEPVAQKTTPAKPKKKKVKNKQKSLTRKARLASNKRYFLKKKSRRR